MDDENKYQYWVDALFMKYILTAMMNVADGKYDEAERLYLLYKNELRDAFLDDFIKFEEIGIIPEEYREDVEKIKRILNERKKGLCTTTN